MEVEKIKSIIESILFVSGEPVKLGKLAKVIGVSKAEAENAIGLLRSEYETGRGFSIVKKDDEVQLVSLPENAEYVSRLVKSEIQENLSQAALETLSIVAYRGPISRSDIEAIRGVNSSFTVRSLLLRGLLERMDNPNDSRSYLYKISFDFLKKLGLDDVSKLPDFENLSKDDRVESIVKINEPGIDK